MNQIRGIKDPDIVSRWEQWADLAERSVERDELGRWISKEVVRNLRVDRAIGRRGVAKFLRTLLRDDPAAGAWQDVNEAIASFKTACYNNQRHGPSRKDDHTVLWRVIPQSLLLDAVNLASGELPGTLGLAWTRFRAAVARADMDTVSSMLEDAPLDPRGFQIFCTFRDQDMKAAWTDPSNWDGTLACAALGISKFWPGYRKGDALWTISYRLPGEIKLHVPTFADADWRSLFRPMRRRSGLRAGRTIPLGPIRAQLVFSGKHPQEGMPEIVHQNALLSRIRAKGAHATLTACLESVPNFLGFHQGW